MGDDRTRILDLLASGKITAEEAARLLDALDATTAQAAGTAGGDESSGTDAAEAAGAGAKSGGKTGWPRFFSGPGVKTTQRAGASGTPKFMYVKVLSVKGDNVNVKIPIALLRAGLKLTSLIPPQAADQINKAMADKGMKFDLNNFKPEDLEELIEAIRDEVDAANGDKIRVSAG